MGDSACLSRLHLDFAAIWQVAVYAATAKLILWNQTVSPLIIFIYNKTSSRNYTSEAEKRRKISCFEVNYQSSCNYAMGLGLISLSGFELTLNAD